MAAMAPNGLDGPLASTPLGTPPQTSVADKNPSSSSLEELVAVDMLTKKLPLSGAGLPGLRVRRRALRRLDYRNEMIEQDAEEGDLGHHSLSDGLLQDSPSPSPFALKKTSPMLPKRLISLRKKRGASPFPSANLLDALTALLSPQTAGAEGDNTGRLGSESAGPPLDTSSAGLPDTSSVGMMGSDTPGLPDIGSGNGLLENLGLGILEPLFTGLGISNNDAEEDETSAGDPYFPSMQPPDKFSNDSDSRFRQTDKPDGQDGDQMDGPRWQWQDEDDPQEQHDEAPRVKKVDLTQANEPDGSTSSQTPAAPSDAPSEIAPGNASEPSKQASQPDGTISNNTSSDIPPPTAPSSDQGSTSSSDQDSAPSSEQAPAPSEQKPASEQSRVSDPTAGSSSEQTASPANEQGTGSSSDPGQTPSGGATPDAGADNSATPAEGEAPAEASAPSTSDQTAQAPPEEAPAQRMKRAVDNKPQSLQQLRLRRSSERSRRSAVQSRFSSSPMAASAANPRYSPTPTFTSPVFVSSPLSKAWRSSSAPYSPSIYSSPAPMYEDSPIDSCGFGNQQCPNATPLLSSPIAGFGAQVSFSPILRTTPVMTQSPIMSPLIESSESFSTPSATYEGQSFETTMYSAAASQATSATSPGSGFYSAVIATSIIGAAMCMSAFGILAWLLFRRRTPYHRPIISHPVLKYSSNSSINPDDDGEKAQISPNSHYNQGEPPSIPESVLPSNTWRPSMQYPMDGFGNADTSMRDIVTHARNHTQNHQVLNSPDPGASMPGTFGSASRYSHMQNDTQFPDQRSPSLPQTPALSRPPTAIARGDYGHDYVQNDYSRQQTNSMHSSYLRDAQDRHFPKLSESETAYPDARRSTDSIEETSAPVGRARSHSRSVVSAQSAPWELRKAAILASAHSTSASNARPLPSTGSAPGKLSGFAVQNSTETAPSTSPPSSDELASTMLDNGFEDAGSPNAKMRPISQDANTVRNKLKKANVPSARKVRPATIGAAPPSILVTNHPQALVPPPSPLNQQRASLYSLTDTLPYLASASQSMASFGSAQVQDDISLIDPLHKRQSTQTIHRRSSLRDRASKASSAAEEESNNRCSLADSCQSEPSGDPNSDEERFKRSQRRRTLLESVYKQQEENTKAAVRAINEDVFTLDAQQQTPGKHMRSKSRAMSQALPPLTPPYTPKETQFPREELIAETPTRRSRSVSAGAPGEGPSLDAALTRFSRLDLASEFSLSKFGSVGSLKSAAKEPGGREGGNEASGAVSSKILTTQSKRQSLTAATSTAALPEAFPKPPRRARASTISCDQFKSNTAESMMTKAARVPLPTTRGKATRVSFAPTNITSPADNTPIRSIAQDLRASVSYPSAYEPSTRPNSFRTTMSSFRSSDYDFDHVVDFHDEGSLSGFSSSQNGTSIGHRRKDATSRVSNGSLGIPDDDDDDRSVYSRDSGAHESPWEIAKARVRARASLALPSVSETLA